MAFEADITIVLKAIVPRVFPDVAPEPLPARPFVVYQQVGGETINPLTVETAAEIPDLRHARMQIVVWDNSRLSASATARLIENAMRIATQFKAEPVGAMVSDYDADVKLYGARADFSVWYR